MKPRMHHLVRLLALVVIAGSLTYAAQRSNVRTDLTSDGLSQVTPGTKQLLRSIGTEVQNEFGETELIPPVVVTAWTWKLNCRALDTERIGRFIDERTPTAPGAD